MHIEDESWSDGGMVPVDDQTHDQIVVGYQEQTVLWRFTDVVTDEQFAGPVLLLDMYTRNDGVKRVVLPPGAVASLNHILADHVMRIWGSADQTVHDLSDEAISKLINDITTQDKGGKGGNDE